MAWMTITATCLSCVSIIISAIASINSTINYYKARKRTRETLKKFENK